MKNGKGTKTGGCLSTVRYLDQLVVPLLHWHPMSGVEGGTRCVWVRAPPGSETAATSKVYFFGVFSSPSRSVGWWVRIPWVSFPGE